MLQLAIICLLIFVLIYFLMYYSSVKPALEAEAKAKKSMAAFWVLMGFAFVLRLITAFSIEGYSTDINCFKAWSNMAYNGGLSDFYFTDAFTDYPPGYIYILYILGFLRDMFGVAYGSLTFTVMIKMPAVICDMLSGFIIYKAAGESEKAKPFALPLAALYLLNPAVIINSSAWGQVDSVYALFVILFMYLLYKNKVVLSAAVFTVGFMIKPQTVMFAPVVIGYFIYRLVFEKDKKLLFKQTALSALTALAIAFVIALPFTKGIDFSPVISQYAETIKSYPYASVNAYNLFMMFGGNWKDIGEPFMFFSYGVWSDIFIVLITAAAIIMFIRSEGKKSYYEIGAFIIIAVFTLAGKMHERYVFPAMLLLIMAFIRRPDKRYLFVYMGVSITQMINASVVLWRDMALNTTSMPDGSLPYLVAAANIAILVYLCVFLMRDKKEIKAGREVKGFELKKSEKEEKLVRADYIIMAAVTLVYAVVAFINLGDIRAAKTHTIIPAGTTVTFTLEAPVSKMKWYTGCSEERKIDIYCDGEMTQDLTAGSVFCWHEETVTAERAVEIYFYSETDITELAFSDGAGRFVEASAKADNGVDLSNLFDERDLVPEDISYKNSTYFDEIYHARTAYEHINSMDPYEDTHPPLGKLIIAIGILIFGMSPFGWRFSGTVCGIIMLPVIYIFAKKMFKSTKTAAFAMVLFALDFMHFAQTRIATIDVYVTLFIMLMFLFMYKYTRLSFYDTPLVKTFIPLGLSGLFFGLAAASKWTGLYGGAGLCVIFFISLGRRIYEYYKVKGSKTATEEEKKAVSVMPKYVLLTVLFCIGMFVIVPTAIYCVSYIPYLKAPGMEGFKSIVENQFSMFDYHSNLEATHPYSSQWFQWPLMIRPVWYYSNNLSQQIRQTIVSFGNPAVWWLGAGAVIYIFVKAIKTRNTPYVFLGIAFLAQFLPWVGVSRCVFLYHYFPSVPFMILAMACVYDNMKKELRKDNADWCALAVSGVAAVLFVVFYPALSGMSAPDNYLDMLRWLPTWVF